MGRSFHETTQKMSESRILVRLLRMYFPRNWEFGSALSKLRNFGGGGFEHPKLPPRYATDAWSNSHQVNKIAFYFTLKFSQAKPTAVFSCLLYHVMSAYPRSTMQTFQLSIYVMRCTKCPSCRWSADTGNVR